MDWLWRKLGAATGDELSGLRMPPGDCWAIDSPAWDAEVAFAALAMLADGESLLYLEGGSHSNEVDSLIAAHRVSPREQIARGTIWPRQEVYHLPASREVFAGLSRLADHHAVPEICDHLVIYRPAMILVDWYDAFARIIYASATLSEQSIQDFSAAVGGAFRVESV